MATQRSAAADGAPPDLVQQYLEAVEELILAGASLKDIRTHAGKKLPEWQPSDEELERYTDAVLDKIHSATITQERARAESIARLRRLYAKLNLIQDYKGALAVQKELNKILLSDDNKPPEPAARATWPPPEQHGQDESPQIILAPAPKAKRPVGRPSKLTPTTRQAIVDALQLGATYELASGYAGISYDSFNQWMIKGEVQESGDYREFFNAVKDAEGRGAYTWLTRIEEASAEEWTAAAWKLERRYPQSYGRQVREHTGPNGGAIEFKGVRELSDADVEAQIRVFENAAREAAELAAKPRVPRTPRGKGKKSPGRAKAKGGGA